MRSTLCAICLALVGAMIPIHGVRADCVDYGSYLHWLGGVNTAGGAYGVAASGGIACIADYDHGVYVVDVSDPRNPEITGTLGTGDDATAVAISGTYAYVTTLQGDMYCDAGRLLVIDLSDPSDPQIVGGASVGNCASGVCVSGNRAYVTTYYAWPNGGNGLRIFDITDPRNPSPLGRIDLSDDAYAVAVSGSYAYVADWSSLVVIDVSNPVKPQIVGSVPTHYNSNAIAISGSYAYLGSTGLLTVIDITNPQHPGIVSSIYVPCALGVALSGHYVYVSDWSGGGGNGLQVVDVANPLKPTTVGGFPSQGTRGVAVSGTLACIADQYGMQVIDITDPVSVPPLGSVTTPGAALDVAVSGTHAYVADAGSGLQVIDVADPRRPSLVGSAGTPGSANDAAVSGNYACVAWSSADNTGGIEVIDVSNPESPEITGVITMSDAAGIGVAVSDGGLGLIVDRTSSSGHFQVVDIADPWNPVVVGIVNTQGRPSDVVSSGSYAYVAETTSSYPSHGFLQVIDITNPYAPAILASMDMGVWGVNGLAVSGRYVYIESFDHLFVIDVQDPGAPVVVGSLLTEGYGQSVALMGTTAYIGQTLVVEAIDVSNPQNPRLIGGALGRGAGVAASGSLVYVATEGSDLKIVPIQCMPAGIFGGTGAAQESPLRVSPSPTAHQTTIHFSLPAEGHVSMTILDVTGREVRSLIDALLGAGPHDLVWDGRDAAGRDVAAGVYLARASTSGGVKTTRIVIAR